MSARIIAAGLAMLAATAARAEEPWVGLYIGDGTTARLVLPAPQTPPPGGAVTVLFPEIGGPGLRRAGVVAGEPVAPAENDLMVFEDPAAFAVTPAPGEDLIGIAVLPGGEGPTDIDGNGIAETPLACTSAESVQLALAEGEGAALRLVWYQPVYLGYDTEPTCSEDFFAAAERATAD